MLHLRLLVSPERLDRVMAGLDEIPGVCNRIVIPGVGRDPDGPEDLVLLDAPGEAGNQVITLLRDLGLHTTGSISAERLEFALSDRHRRAEEAALGDPADAVVWEEVEWRLRREATLSLSFMTLMVAAVLVATVGVLTDSVVLIVGAMVIGPEFGPLAALAWGLQRRRRRWVRDSLRTLILGFGCAIAAAMVLAAVTRWTGSTPTSYLNGVRPLTRFVAEPDGWSIVVAAVAAIAGMLSLTELRAGPLVGVVISVTTVPAAANVAIAVVYAHWTEARGAVAQLLVNLVVIVLVGAFTLAVERTVETRHHRRPQELRPDRFPAFGGTPEDRQR